MATGQVQPEDNLHGCSSMGSSTTALYWTVRFGNVLGRKPPPLRKPRELLRLLHVGHRTYSRRNAYHMGQFQPVERQSE